MSHRFHIAVYHVTHRFHIVVYQVTHRFHIVVYNVSHRFHIVVYHVSHRFHIVVYNVSHRFHIAVYHVSHRFHIAVYHVTYSLQFLLFTMSGYSPHFAVHMIVHSGDQSLTVTRPLPTPNRPLHDPHCGCAARCACGTSRTSVWWIGRMCMKW